MMTPAQALQNCESLFNRELPAGMTGLEARAMLESIGVLKGALAKLSALEAAHPAAPTAPAAAKTPAQMAAEATAHQATVDARFKAAQHAPAPVAAKPVAPAPVKASPAVVAVAPAPAPVAAAPAPAPVVDPATAISAPTVSE